MSIKFLCPNGHPLSCGDDRAGKPGKCPKCGTQFVVPDAEEIAAAASNGATQRGETVSVGAGSKVSSAASGGAPVSVAPGSGKSNAAKPGSGVGQPAIPADHIVFLCPNGHRLNGPQSLQGRPGQCPHCGEKFRIPIYDAEQPLVEPQEELEEDLEEFPTENISEEEEIPVGMAVDNDISEELDGIETFPETDEMADEPFEATLQGLPPLPPGPTHPLFEIFSRLWAFQPERANVEVTLKDGKTIQPIQYSPTLSRQAYGVFALANNDGTLRVLMVPWDSVASIEFQQLDDLPAAAFC